MTVSSSTRQEETKEKTKIISPNLDGLKRWGSDLKWFLFFIVVIVVVVVIVMVVVVIIVIMIVMVVV